MRDRDPRLEAAARRRLTRLVAAVAVPSTPTPDPVEAVTGPVEAMTHAVAGQVAPRRRRAVAVVVAAIVVVAVGAAAAVVLGQDGEPGERTATAPMDGGTCEPTVAGENTVEGTFPDGSGWSLDVIGPGMDDGPEGGEWVEGAFANIDGEGAGGWTFNAESWPSLVDLGHLSWRFGGVREHRLFYGHVPMTAARIEVDLADGTSLSACPVAVPATDLLSYFGVPLPPATPMVAARALDAQGRTIAGLGPRALEHAWESLEARGGGVGVNAAIDPDVVPLPLGGVEAEVPPPPVLADVVSGEVPSGRWALRVGRDGERLVVHLVLPTRVGPAGSEGTVGQLTGPDANWNVGSTDGRHVVWGIVVPDVEEVVVTLGDGSSGSPADAGPASGRPVGPVEGRAPGQPVGVGPSGWAARSGGSGSLVGDVRSGGGCGPRRRAGRGLRRARAAGG